MSGEHLGRIENSSDSGKAQQFSQPWTPQMMTPKLDLSGAGAQVPSEFGSLQIADNGKTTQLRGAVHANQQTESTPYPFAPEKYKTSVQHHDRLHGSASDTLTSAHNQPHRQQPRMEYLVGQTTVPASMTPAGFVPSEKITTTLPASNYHEGEQFNQVLIIPPENGKHNFYNGLANAHYGNGHLYGVPVHSEYVEHMEHGRRVKDLVMKSHLDHEVDIPLYKK